MARRLQYVDYTYRHRIAGEIASSYGAGIGLSGMAVGTRRLAMEGVWDSLPIYCGVRLRIVPFDPNDRTDFLQHFADHGRDFGSITPAAYEAMADHFMTRGPVVPPLYECTRPNGMVCRYDAATDEYGVKYSGGYLATYFRPVAAGHLPKHLRPVPSHGFRTNMDYFRNRCN
jgi:hypothetical protein